MAGRGVHADRAITRFTRLDGVSVDRNDIVDTPLENQHGFFWSVVTHIVSVVLGFPVDCLTPVVEMSPVSHH
jgi:hypothetical protein